ncbi:MAG: helix-turn-helix domain-containing protein [Thermoanaerobaculia bacterium]|nr:helix-turn-helix domain-containing protein [Thermoanaerobaculia bacterium]
MTWNDLSPTLRHLAANTLTPRQLTILKLREDGMTINAIALHLDVSTSTIRTTITESRRKLERELRRQHHT